MDKEAREKIAEVDRLAMNRIADLIDSSRKEHTPPIVAAKYIVLDMRKLGYRKLPKDEPPLVETTHKRFKPDWKGYKNCRECEEAVAQAQRGSDIKHYEGEQGEEESDG